MLKIKKLVLLGVKFLLTVKFKLKQSRNENGAEMGDSEIWDLSHVLLYDFGQGGNYYVLVLSFPILYLQLSILGPEVATEIHGEERPRQ